MPPTAIKKLDAEIASALAKKVPSEAQLRELATRIPEPDKEPATFAKAKVKLREAMGLVAQKLSSEWTSARYVRARAGDEDE